MQSNINYRGFPLHEYPWFTGLNKRGTYLTNFRRALFKLSKEDATTYHYFYVLKSVSLKIEPLQYIAIYYDGSIFNETYVIIYVDIS